MPIENSDHAHSRRLRGGANSRRYGERHPDELVHVRTGQSLRQRLGLPFASVYLRARGDNRRSSMIDHRRSRTRTHS